MSDENDYAKGWRAESGDEIEGKVVQVDAGNSDYGTYPILTLEGDGLITFRTKDGMVSEPQAAIHCVHSILRREIARNYDPSKIVGQPIKIKYLGKGVVQNGKFAGKEFHNYKVFGGNRAYDWSRDLPEGERSSVDAWGAGATSAPVTAEPPIPPADLGPLPPRNEPTVQQQAEQNFGSQAPF